MATVLEPRFGPRSAVLVAVHCRCAIHWSSDPCFSDGDPGRFVPLFGPFATRGVSFPRRRMGGRARK